MNSCPSFFQSGTNFSWVTYQYVHNNATLIQPYRLGKIPTEEFLQSILNIFDFLKDATLDDEDLQRLAGRKFSSQEPVLQLLEEAFNEVIYMDENRALRFSHLVAKAEQEPVYLISNTNELDVLKIIELLKKHNRCRPRKVEDRGL